MHRFYFLVSWRERKGLPEIKCILHFPCGVVLGLEEGVEIPERLLDNATIEFLKSHFEEDFPHLGDDPLVGMDLARIGFFRKLGHIVPAEVRCLPCT